MGFFIRCAFWLSLAFLVIPFFTAPQAQEDEQDSPAIAMAARDVLRDITGLCAREPHVCDAAKTAFAAIAAHAREGLRLAIALVEEDTPDPARPPAPLVDVPQERKAASR